jgi:hypothetical protein
LRVRIAEVATSFSTAAPPGSRPPSVIVALKDGASLVSVIAMVFVAV